MNWIRLGQSWHFDSTTTVALSPIYFTLFPLQPIANPNTYGANLPNGIGDSIRHIAQYLNSFSFISLHLPLILLMMFRAMVIGRRVALLLINHPSKSLSTSLSFTSPSSISSRTPSELRRYLYRTYDCCHTTQSSPSVR